MAYYGTGRLWVHKRERPRRGESNGDRSRLVGYRAALEAASDQKGFAAWMAKLEYASLQRVGEALFSGRDLLQLEDVRSPLHESVVKTACACLEGATAFYYNIVKEELWVDFEDGSSVPFAQLSDGQRNTIAVAADIAWRATQLNPHLGEDAPKKTRGVVLIDEVELHLHPAWQARVLDDLTSCFPKIQFVVSTHAPQVMASARVGSMRLIDRDHTVSMVGAKGKSANVILEDVLGVPARPRWAKDQLSTLGALLEKGDLVAGRELLESLEAQWPGDEDPDLVAARWELEMAERGAVERVEDEADSKGA